MYDIVIVDPDRLQSLSPVYPAVQETIDTIEIKTSLHSLLYLPSKIKYLWLIFTLTP